MKHTATPWKVSKTGDFITVDNETHAPICRMAYTGVWDWAAGVGTIENKANAALIVKSVNNHHALKHACKLAMDALTTTYENGKGVVDAQAALHAFGNLKAALTAVGKES